MKRKYATLKDIANYLGISISTVSRALNNNINIKKETKEQILATARLLNYRSNPIGLSLKHGTTRTIGVLVPEMITPFASDVIKGIQRTLNREGYKVIIAQSDEDPQIEKENLQLMENFMVDGIIICYCDYKTNKLEYTRLQNTGTPIVFYDRIPFGMDVTQVIVDDYRKSFFMIEHLVSCGRKRIIYMQGPDIVYNSVERERGYKDALKKFGIPFDKALVIKSGMSINDGRKAAEIIIKSGIKFDAIFAFTETLALGATNYLKYYHIKIPKDVAVACFSGTILSTIVHPQLTSIEQPTKLMGETAANLIIEKIKNPLTPNKKIILSSEIKLRASTEINIL